MHFEFELIAEAHTRRRTGRRHRDRTPRGRSHRASRCRPRGTLTGTISRPRKILMLAVERSRKPSMVRSRFCAAGWTAIHPQATLPPHPPRSLSSSFAPFCGSRPGAAVPSSSSVELETSSPPRPQSHTVSTLVNSTSSRRTRIARDRWCAIRGSGVAGASTSPRTAERFRLSLVAHYLPFTRRNWQ